MLFGGSNPWSGGASSLFGRRQQPPVMQPPVMQPGGGTTGAPLQGYPAPTWPGATPDGNYAQGLAGYYANQLQNQQVPGSVPTGQFPVAPQAAPPGAPPVAPGMPQNGWHDAFRQALGDWRSQRPGFGSGGDMDAMAQWRGQHPHARDFRQQGGY